MNKTLRLIGLLVAAIIIVSGCATTYTTSNGMLAYGEIRGDEVGDFEASDSYMYIVHPELYTIGDKSWETLEDLIEPELSRAGANAASDLTITNGFTTVDFVLTYITGGFLGFSHLTVTGTAVNQ